MSNRIKLKLFENKVENYIPKNEKIKYLYVAAKIIFAVLLSLCKTEK